MLQPSILNDEQLRRGIATVAGAPPLSLDEELALASAGFRALGGAHARLAMAAGSAISASSETPSFKGDFEAAVRAVGSSLEALPGTALARIMQMVPEFLEPDGTGGVALKAYWTGLGFSERRVKPLLDELINARTDLRPLLEIVLRGKGWDRAVRHFGSGHPNPFYWGQGYAAERNIDPLAQEFVLECRRIEVLPSINLLLSLLLLADRASKDISAETREAS